jgi:DNA-directed RNA polymerase specialized sigma24 family protein
METSNVAGPSAYDSDYDADKLLEQYDAYIITLARKRVPRNVIPSEMLSNEIDELAQKIRIKLWRISQKKQITSPKAYISSIAYTESVDIVRNYKSTLSLSVNEDGEIYEGNSRVTLSKGVPDPAENLEQEEAVIELTSRFIEEISLLPPRQLKAVIWSLRDQIEDFLPLLEALKNHGVDIEEMNWPNEREEVQRLRASLSIARRKLNILRKKYK